MTERYTLQELVEEWEHIGRPPLDVAAPRLGLGRWYLERRLSEARKAGLIKVSNTTTTRTGSTA